ncbi:MAG: HD domain-containing phosphohydrolase [Candidatus Aminicenantales bacterium]
MQNSKKLKIYYKIVYPKELFKKILSESEFSRFRRFFLVILYDIFPARSLLLTLKFKHLDTYGHCRRVATLSGEICREYLKKYGGKTKIKDVKKAALFHDIGKLFISRKILKEKRLTELDMKEIREHPEEGAELAAGILKPKIVKSIYEHQEEMNGSGYPRGLDGDDLSLPDKIISVADDYCAMTEKRAYNMPKNLNDAIRDIKKNRGVRYDERVVEVFCRIKSSKFSQDS